MATPAELETALRNADAAGDAEAARALAGALMAARQTSPQPVPASPAGGPSILEDVAGGVQGGIIRGAASVPGMVGSGLDLLEQGADWAARNSVGRAVNAFKSGGSDWGATPYRPIEHGALSAVRNLPKVEDTVRAAEGIIGETYRPQTLPGKMAATAGEFLGGGVRPAAALIGGGASEMAGQLTQGTVAEPVARVAAAILAPAAAGRVMTPVRGDPARQPLVDALAREGVDVSAGQSSGSKALRYAESALSDLPLAGGGARELADRQGRQFTQAAARRMGENADLLTPEAMTAASDRIGGQFRDLSARNALQADPQLASDIGRSLREYDRVLPADQRRIVGDLASDIVQRFQAGGGVMPGADYQTIRSRLSRTSNNNRQSDPDFADALRGLRNSLDEGMARSIRPEDAGAWETARREYGNMKTIERALAGAGEATAAGYVSPQALRQAVSSRDRTAYVRGEGDLAELARAGAGVLQPMPQSGTAPRASIAGIVSSLGGGAAASGSPGLTGAAMAAAAAPSLVGRALMSRPIQTWLSNRAVQAEPTLSHDRVVRALLGYQ